MNAIQTIAPQVGTAAACSGLGIARATYYRHLKPREPQPVEATQLEPPRPASPRALDSEERQAVLDVLHSEPFADKAPAEVYATLLDQGTYHCSIRTMYRILHDAKEVRERRNQTRHPKHAKPELVATAPNQVWSWDITKLLGPVKWTYFQLYVILDIYSRYVVGWMLAHRESEDLAERLIRETLAKQGVVRDQLTIHSDRGPAMRSQTVAQMLASLGVVKSHSRPHVSNDNPFSESQFKTLKYRPEFPNRFDSFEHAKSFCTEFFQWQNHEHHHWGIGLLTPATVHHGHAETMLAARQAVLDQAHVAHPERFVRKPPTPLRLPTHVCINPPASMPESRIVELAISH